MKLITQFSATSTLLCTNILLSILHFSHNLYSSFNEAKDCEPYDIKNSMQLYSALDFAMNTLKHLLATLHITMLFCILVDPLT